MNRVLFLLFIILALLGCKKSGNRCLSAASISAGVGVQSGRGRICLDATLGEIRLAKGPEDLLEDLGRLGFRFAYRDAHLSGLVTDGSAGARVKAVYIHQGVPEKTGEGIGIGSLESAVKSAFGEPVVDPFLKIWWYLERGIAFTFEQGKVAQIQLFKPRSAN